MAAQEATSDPLPQRSRRGQKAGHMESVSLNQDPSNSGTVWEGAKGTDADQEDLQARREAEHPHFKVNRLAVADNVAQRAAAKRSEQFVDGHSEDAARLTYEFLDHTADVQIHAWGASLEQAFESTVIAMFDYMTDVRTVDVDSSLTQHISVQGHDLQSLLYSFMNEFLYLFSTDGFVCREVVVTKLDRETNHIEAEGRGETFDLGKHPQGTEVKAITYSAMQIIETASHAEVYVIVDI